MKEETTYGMSPERIARLLAIGLERTDREDDLLATGTPAEALEDMMVGALPLDPAMPDSLPGVLKQPCEEMLAVADRTMGDLLLDSKTDLAVIKVLKDYGKELVRCLPEAKQAAATAIYYAAIASALVFNEQKITQHPYDKLHRAFADLEEKPWIPSELKDLFRKARKVCRQRRRRAE